MKILKGYVFRMYPTEKQEELINKTIGCSRFIYNHFLDDKIKDIELKQFIIKLSNQYDVKYLQESTILNI